MQGIGCLKAFSEWEFLSAKPEVKFVESGELSCAEKYRKVNGDGQEACKDMVLAASHLEDGRFEEGSACAERALQAFRDAGELRGIVDAIRLLVFSYRAKGWLKEAHDLVHQEMEAFSAQGEQTAMARMLLLLSHINHDKRGSQKRQRAREWAMQARRLFADTGEKRLEAQALLALVNVVIKERQNPFAAIETKQLVDAAVPLLRSTGDLVGEAKAMHGLACAMALSGCFEGAADAGKEAVQLFHKAKRRQLEAFELHCLASWFLVLEDPEKAAEAAESSMQIYIQDGQTTAQAAVLQLLMKTYLMLKDLPRALEAAWASLERFEEAKDVKAQAVALEMLAMGYMHCADFVQAARLAEQEAKLLQDHDLVGQSRALRLRCHLLAQLQDYGAAIEAAAQAAAVSAEVGRAAEQARTLQLMADCQLRNDALADGRDTALQARNVYQDLMDCEQEVLAMLQASQASALLGERPRALELAAEAKDLAKRSGRRDAEGVCWHTLASLHLDWGRLADALKMAQKALVCAKRCANFKEQGRSILLSVIISIVISKECEEAESAGVASSSSEVGHQEHLRRAQAKVQELRYLAEKAAEPFCSACFAHATGAVLQQTGNYEEALRMAQAALAAYEECGDLMGVLHMYLLMARGFIGKRSFQEARDATESAVWLGEQLGFRSIAENSKLIFQEIEAREAEAPESGIPEMPMVPKLDVQDLDLDLVQGAVLKFVQVLIRSDAGIAADTPLLDMGLTSHLAVVLRDQLAKVLPGLSPPLPVTLIYDYPSIAAITQLVADSAETSRRVPET